MIPFKYKGYQVKVGDLSPTLNGTKIPSTVRVKADNGMDSNLFVFRLNPPNQNWFNFVKLVQKTIDQRIKYLEGTK
mgnify:CR=1 FL=1